MKKFMLISHGDDTKWMRADGICGQNLCQSGKGYNFAEYPAILENLKKCKAMRHLGNMYV